MNAPYSIRRYGFEIKEECPVLTVFSCFLISYFHCVKSFQAAKNKARLAGGLSALSGKSASLRGKALIGAKNVLPTFGGKSGTTAPRGKGISLDAMKAGGGLVSRMMTLKVR